MNYSNSANLFQLQTLHILVAETDSSKTNMTQIINLTDTVWEEPYAIGMASQKPVCVYTHTF